MSRIVRYRAGRDAGLLKIRSKMGVSGSSSYRGGLNFEAVGLSRSLVNEYFPGMASRISGIGLAGIQRKVTQVHALGWLGGADVLPIGGFYKARRTGETHAWTATNMHLMKSDMGGAAAVIGTMEAAAIMFILYMAS